MKSRDPHFPLIDAEHFLENMCDDISLCLDILETALLELDEQMPQIGNLKADSEDDFAIRSMHSLRGGSSVFEASSLVDLLQAMESRCEANGVKSILPDLEEFRTVAQAYRGGLLGLIEEFRSRL